MWIPIFFILALVGFLSPAENAHSAPRDSRQDKLSDFCLRALSSANLRLDSNTEERGVVSVPVDHHRPNGPQLELVWRKVPKVGDEKFDSKQKLAIIVINGGPGMRSGIYRSYGYDDRKSPHDQPQEYDSLNPVVGSYPMILFDQRGTNGLSSAIQLKEINGDHKIVAQYFGSHSVAKDLDLLLSQILEPGTRFVLIGQSYGGRILSQYLTLRNRKTNPQGVIFSSSSMPYYTSTESGGSGSDFLKRREMQMVLNLRLSEAYPEIANDIRKLTAHFKALGLEPEIVHHLWHYLGTGETGVWEKNLAEKIKTLSTATLEEIAAEFKKAIVPEVLNYILSSTEMTPGMTDRNLAKTLIKKVPLEDWMLDEQKSWLQNYGLSPEEADVLDRVDRDVPTATQFATLDALVKAMQKQPTLFTFADQDSMIPPTLRPIAEKTYPPGGNISYRTLTGGHRAILTKSGLEAIDDWVKKNKLDQ